MSILTRSYLYKTAREALIRNKVLKDSFSNSELLIDLFEFSENYTKILEKSISKADLNNVNFNVLHKSILKEINKFSIKHKKSSKALTDSINKTFNSTKNKKPLLIYESVFNKLTNFEKKFFSKKCILYNENDNFCNAIGTMPKTFLSYAYDDKVLSLALFIYFFINGGYLYVDWMHNDAINDSKILKDDIKANLSNSKQFLLLRTIKSELRKSNVRDTSNIRQWCAWEIGSYYDINPNEKYYTSFSEDETTMGFNRNDLLNTFKVLHCVKNGIMQ